MGVERAGAWASSWEAGWMTATCIFDEGVRGCVRRGKLSSDFAAVTLR